jgi:hypothetical protein
MSRILPAQMQPLLHFRIQPMALAPSPLGIPTSQLSSVGVCVVVIWEPVTADCGCQGSSSNIAFTRCTVRAITAILKRCNASAVASVSSEGANASHVLHVSRPTSPRRRSLGLPAVSIEAQSPFCLPPQDDTIVLIHKYFNTTGTLFPFIHKEGFLKEYREARLSNFSKVSRTWLGLLYMVLAMAINAAPDGDVTAAQRIAESDVFYQRARAVCERSVRIGASLENGMIGTSVPRGKLVA